MNKPKKNTKLRNMDFAKKMKLLRGKVSQEALAKILKISQSRMARLELGSEPYASELIKISKHFNMTLYELLDTQAPNHLLGSAMAGWPDSIIQACDIVHKIMTSDNKIAKDALHTNLVAFEDHERMRKNEPGKITPVILPDKSSNERINKLEEEIRFLKELYNPKIQSDT